MACQSVVLTWKLYYEHRLDLPSNLFTYHMSFLNAFDCFTHSHPSSTVSILDMWSTTKKQILPLYFPSFSVLAKTCLALGKIHENVQQENIGTFLKPFQRELTQDFWRLMMPICLYVFVIVDCCWSACLFCWSCQWVYSSLFFFSHILCLLCLCVFSHANVSCSNSLIGNFLRLSLQV